MRFLVFLDAMNIWEDYKAQNMSAGGSSLNATSKMRITFLDTCQHGFDGHGDVRTQSCRMPRSGFGAYDWGSRIGGMTQL